ncbi:MAG: UvrD-helicase domain-containing protein [Vicinamibacterales bacterium]
MDVIYFRQTQFNDALARMSRSGGVPQQAARKVREIVGVLSLGGEADESVARLTKHGENRIRHCFKYDLPGHHRLIVTHHADVLALLFVGSHSECDRWLDENRGLTVIVDRQTRRLTLVSEVTTVESVPRRQLNLEVPPDQPLLASLPKAYLDRLPVSPSLMMRLLSLRATASDEDVESCAAAASDGDAQMLLLSVLLALRDGHAEGAMALLDKAAGAAATASDNPEVFREALGAEVNSDAVVNLRELSEIEIEHLFTRASFRQWLTFLHPDQKRLVTSNFPGPAALSGVSGSGKTSVLVHRAKYLAGIYSADRILVVTLNAALASLIQSLLEELCPPATASRIDAWSIAELCGRIVRFFDASQHLLTEDHRSGEDLEDCWDDSYAKDEQFQTLEPIVRSLKNTYGVDPIRYIRDEFIWARSGLRATDIATSALASRVAYEDPEQTPREGRSIPFSVDWRKRMLAALAHYEEHLSVGGFVDAAGLSLEAHRFIDALACEPHPFRYRAVLVDEVQDLGNVELEIVRSLAPSLENGLLLSGDSNQQVFPKSHNLATAGVRIQPTERRYLRKNYRNTKEILEAGLALLSAYGRTDLLSESEARGLSPELSVRSGPKPLVVAAASDAEERQFIVSFVAQQLELKPDAPICIVVSGLRDDSPKLLVRERERLASMGLETRLLSGEGVLLTGGVYLAAMETIKGFEFSVVVIARCSRAIIPDPETPTEERWREARRLYVAMTRGRDEVIFTHSGNPSEYLGGMGAFLQHSTVTAQG